MSYTPPNYVDTKAQAILALASVVADEDKTALGDGSVNKALDVLADVLADSDVQVPQTNAGAILALAQYASGMLKPEGTISITENGEGIDVAQYASADVSVSGGGGDLTTATVTMQATEGLTYDLSLHCACVASGEGAPDATATVVSSEESSYEFTAVLYKGKCLAYSMNENVTITATGDVTYDSDLELYIITGDCTFTFANA